MASEKTHKVLPLSNLYAAHLDLLRGRLQLLLTALHPALLPDVLLALGAEGKLLSQPCFNTKSAHPPPAGIWPLLTLLVAQHISPEVNSPDAGSVAVAVECLICALDLLDDVEDDDQTTIVQALGIARALNVSTTLLMLAQKAILSLPQQDVPPIRIQRLLETFQEAVLVATSGQHRDLLAEQRSAQELTLEECIDVARAKAGSLMRLACHLGALFAGADDLLCDQFSELGELLGIAHQLDNDCHGLYYLLQGHVPAPITTDAVLAPRMVTTDLVRGKKTLPLVIAARGKETSRQSSLPAEEHDEEDLRALREGIVTTWGICMLYRERARDRLQEIEASQPVAPALRLLLGLE